MAVGAGRGLESCRERFSERPRRPLERALGSKEPWSAGCVHSWRLAVAGVLGRGATPEGSLEAPWKQECPARGEPLVGAGHPPQIPAPWLPRR